MASLIGRSAVLLGVLCVIGGAVLTVGNSPLMDPAPNMQLAFLGIGIFSVGVLLVLGGIAKLV